MTKHNILRKQYTLNERNYQLKIPMELDACIPEDDCVRLISQFVEELDLAALYGTYERTDISSRTIEKNCRQDINYMYLLEGRKAPRPCVHRKVQDEAFCKMCTGAPGTDDGVPLRAGTGHGRGGACRRHKDRSVRQPVHLRMEEVHDKAPGRVPAEDGPAGGRHHWTVRLRSLMAQGGEDLCRGRDNVHAESILFAMAHNLGWLHRRIQDDRLDLHLYELKEDTGKAA